MNNDDENKPITQTSLLGNEELDKMVFDASLPLKPPRKPRAPAAKKRVQYSPVADPDTIDLFDDPEGHFDVDPAVTDELRANANEMIDDLVDEFTEEIEQRLRSELSTQLASILEDLNHRDDGKGDI